MINLIVKLDNLIIYLIKQMSGYIFYFILTRKLRFSYVYNVCYFACNRTKVRASNLVSKQKHEEKK